MGCKVILHHRVARRVFVFPPQVQRALRRWIELLHKYGLENTRKIPGYHDEPLKGTRRGQRSVRLSRAWRAIYVVEKGQPVIIQVIEVHKHDY